MIQYSSFFLTALILLFIVLCGSGSSLPVSSAITEKDTDDLNGNKPHFLKGFADIFESSSEFSKSTGESISKYIEFFEDDKKQLQDAVFQGMEIEKRIQNISNTLKNITIPLIKKFQSELETIGENVSTELINLKTICTVEDINDMEKKTHESYRSVRGMVESLSNKAVYFIQIYTKEPTSEENVTQMENDVFGFINTALPALQAINEDGNKVNHKLHNAYELLSKIRKYLNKAEQIEFHVLQLYSDLSQRDFASSIRFSFTECFFALLFGMFLTNFE